MNELLNIGINPENINFQINAESRQTENYQTQISAATMKAWGSFWPQEISEAVKKSDLFSHIATTAAKVIRILGIKKFPRLGLFNGFQIGMMNYYGYCWEDENKQIWIGFDELWFGDIGEQIARNGKQIPPHLRNKISFVLAEEIFHAYIREVKPDLAEENIQANASGNPKAYWESKEELAAKEFANLYISKNPPFS